MFEVNKNNNQILSDSKTERYQMAFNINKKVVVEVIMELIEKY